MSTSETRTITISQMGGSNHWYAFDRFGCRLTSHSQNTPEEVMLRFSGNVIFRVLGR